MTALRIENAYYYTSESNKTTDTIPKGHTLFLLSTGRTKLITVPIAKTLHPPRKDYQLIYMHNGQLHFFDKVGTAHIAPQGSFVLYKPYEHQEFYITAEENADKYWCHFDGVFVEQLLKTHDLNDKRIITVPPDKRYLQLFQLMRSTLDSKPDYFTELCNLYLQELIVTIGSEYKKQNLYEIFPESVKNVLEYIRNNYYEKLTVEKLSKIGMTNPKTLTRQFIKYLNEPPIKYLNKFRINKAKILLIQSQHKINEIALSVGFQDPLYFSTVFRAETGLSPREYRNMMLE